MMKTSIIAVFLILINHAVIRAQNDTEELKQTFDSYRSLVEQKAYDQFFEYYLDSFVATITKEELKKALVSISEDERISYTVSNSKLIYISEITEYNSKKYAILKHGSNYHYQFSDQTDEEYRNQIIEKYKKNYGDHFSYNKKQKTISIYKEQELIAVRDSSWKFIPYKKALHPYVSIWIPKDVFEEIMLKKKD